MWQFLFSVTGKDVVADFLFKGVNMIKIFKKTYALGGVGNKLFEIKINFDIIN